MNFSDRMIRGLMLFDGAMGTQIQSLALPESVWDGRLGCSEILNLTQPAAIQAIHEAYLAAGADAIETNTFGANEIVLSDYGLELKVEELNRQAALIARRALTKHANLKPRYVVGSMGPGTKLISLNRVDYQTMYRSYSRQAVGLLEGEVDALIIETCQDLLQIKTCLRAVLDTMDLLAYQIPIIVSVTVETTGSLLIGSEISAVLATLAPFPIAAIGLNCATGPADMRPFIRQLCRQSSVPVICQPNAGLPQNVDGVLRYTLPVTDFTAILTEFVADYGVSLVGGCCGTTPDYINALSKELANLTPAKRTPSLEPSISSLFSAQTLHQTPGPFYVGERTNSNGSKKFRQLLLRNDWDGMLAIARQQQMTGAHGLDLCVAYTGRDESADMIEMVNRISTSIVLPLFIDSTDTAVLEQALQRYGGRAVINSINLEDGEARAETVCALAKRYGAALIALTIDEQGMAHDVETKLAIARRIYELAVHGHGLKASDLIFDPLTFTLGSGDPALKTSAINTLQAILQIKALFPDCFTLLGVSNVSFGLAPEARDLLNSVFLSEAVKAGLDLAIVNVEKITPLYQIEPADVAVCLDLVYNRGADDPLLAFIEHFQRKTGQQSRASSEDNLAPLADRISQRLIQGSRADLENLLTQALESQSALSIINDILIPAMKKVGDLFGAGNLQLPFVLQSAEVMKYAVDRLQPFLTTSELQQPTSIVLATVRGDVHDIGKNLVDIILSNNGYKVYNLGIKCEIGVLLQKAQEVGADALGMSGLLVKSTAVMRENLEEMARRGIHLPVLLGGAALTRSYVDEVCAPLLTTPVIYCADAFDGLKVMEMIKDGVLDNFREERRPSAAASRKPRPLKSLAQDEPPLGFDHEIPIPPFYGNRIVSELNLEAVFSYLTEQVLFRGRWGYRRGSLSKEAYDDLIESRVRPELLRLKARLLTEKLIEPKLIYGYYQCNSEGNRVLVFEPNGRALTEFTFPRQVRAPYRSVADFFLPLSSGKRDLIAFQIVTIGEGATEESNRLYHQNAYRDYLLFHGLSVELTEALAEYWHRMIRVELSIAEQDGATIDDFIVQRYRGSRYSFGYPACPDLSDNRKLFKLLKPERIGVALTDEEQMAPEQTTSAFIVHHPRAKYFSIE